MINKIIEFFFPFTDDPNKFVLKNKRTWYSIYYRNIYYSGNGGKSFKKIYSARDPLFSEGDSVFVYNWTFEPLTFNVQRESFSHYQNKFKSLKDINDYHQIEREKYLKGIEKRKIEREKYIEKIKSNINGLLK